VGCGTWKKIDFADIQAIEFLVTRDLGFKTSLEENINKVGYFPCYYVGFRDPSPSFGFQGITNLLRTMATDLFPYLHYF